MKIYDPEVFADMVVACVKNTIEGPKIKDRFQAIEARLAALEAKQHVKFVGVWQQGKSYAPGDACTHGGGLWICKAATMGQPNQDYAGWTLAVKSRSL